MNKIIKLINENTKLEETLKKIREASKSYLKDNVQSVVIGVSGGIDSALCLAILKPVCEEIKIPIIGAFIDIEGNKLDEKNRASALMETLCHTHLNVNLSLVVNTIENSIGNSLFSNGWAKKVENEVIEKIRCGNIKARTRMIYLYHIAHMTNGLVVSTDNLTEYMLGFWTLHGDVGDFAPIQKMFKTEVYDLAHFIVQNELGINTEAGKALHACIDADATDGLGITNTDLDQLLPDWRERYEKTREGYVEVDKTILSYLNGEDFEINEVILKRILKTEFKRDNPHFIIRDEFTEN